ncbi:MAG: DUF6320 domain-containing protein [Eggerthellaceae bacterium]|nr:DUF6320 domain-containing protein [Eggerthellaceae bacterium]
MMHCRLCGVDYTGDLDRCPLCGTELVGTQSPAEFPVSHVLKSHKLAQWILIILTLLAFAATIVLGIIGNMGIPLTIAVCVAYFINYLLLRSAIIHQPNFLRIVARYFIVLIVVAFLWFILSRASYISTFVIPILCLTAIVFDATFLIIYRGSFIRDYGKYLLFDIILGIIPLILMFTGLATWGAPAVITSASAAVGLLICLIVFAGKRVKEELKKLFSFG